MITSGSLFTGYGGLDMAVERVLGARTLWRSDTKPAAARLIDHHWPGSNLGDITTIDWADVPLVDVITGGFPCQDISAAGQRAGLVRYGDHTRSGLWAHMAAAIDTIRPSLVVAENVRAICHVPTDSAVEPCPWCVGDPPARGLRTLGAVLGDLAGMGYDADWCGVPASAVGAPHDRFRIFVAAYPSGTRVPRRGGHHTPQTRPGRRGGPDHSGSVAVWRHYWPAIRRWERIMGRPAPAPTVPGRRGPRLNPALTEWLMGLPQGWVTAVPGLSARQMLSLTGDGVVPQQAAAALRHLLGDP